MHIAAMDINAVCHDELLNFRNTLFYNRF